MGVCVLQNLAPPRQDLITNTNKNSMVLEGGTTKAIKQI